MICYSVASNLCGTYQNKTAKCFITIDTNHNIPAEIDITGKFFLADVPIDISEQKNLICVIMKFPEELMSQLATLVKLLVDDSDQANHCHIIEVTIRAKSGLDFLLAPLYQWFILPDNIDNRTLMLVFDKDTMFPIL